MTFGLYLSAAGVIIAKSLKEKGLCESHIVLMTQNIKYKNYDSICADDVVHVLGTFDGIEFNYQIMRLFDLIRIRYNTKTRGNYASR